MKYQLAQKKLYPLHWLYPVLWQYCHRRQLRQMTRQRRFLQQTSSRITDSLLSAEDGEQTEEQVEETETETEETETEEQPVEGRFVTSPGDDPISAERGRLRFRDAGN